MGWCSQGPRGVAAGGCAWRGRTWAVMSCATVGASLCLSSSRKLIRSHRRIPPQPPRRLGRTRAAGARRGLCAAGVSCLSGDSLQFLSQLGFLACHSGQMSLPIERRRLVRGSLQHHQRLEGSRSVQVCYRLNAVSPRSYADAPPGPPSVTPKEVVMGK